MTVSAETACQLGYARLRKPLNANSIIQQSVNPTTLHNAIRFAILIYELRLIWDLFFSSLGRRSEDGFCRAEWFRTGAPFLHSGWAVCCIMAPGRLFQMSGRFIENMRNKLWLSVFRSAWAIGDLLFLQGFRDSSRRCVLPCFRNISDVLFKSDYPCYTRVWDPGRAGRLERFASWQNASSVVYCINKALVSWGRKGFDGDPEAR